MIKIPWLTLTTCSLFSGAPSQVFEPQWRRENPDIVNGAVRQSNRALLVFLILLKTPFIYGATEVCCRFDTDKRGVWEETIILPDPEAETSCQWHARFPGEITFAGPDRIVAGIHLDCYTTDGRALEHTQDFLIGIDSHTGKVLKQISWKDISLNSPGGEPNQLLSVKDGNVLFRAGGTLKLCSSDLQEIHTRLLPVQNGHERWDVYLSPSGNIGILKHAASPDAAFSEEHWFSVQTLGEVEIDSAPRYFSGIAVSDDYQIYYRPRKAWVSVTTREEIIAQLRASPVVHVRSRGASLGRPLCDSCHGAPMQVLPNGLLFLDNSGPKVTFWLVDSSGKIVYRGGPYGIAIDSLLDVKCASQRDRFAFTFGHLGTGLFNYGGSDTTVLFDMPTMRAVFQVKIKEHAEEQDGLEYWPGPKIALSVDGTDLVVMDGARLKLFKISGK